MFDSKTFLESLTKHPGVYCMRDKADKVLYIGKAKNLKHRVTSYFRGEHTERIVQMVNRIARIDVTVTNSEKEALILENSLIKSLKPRYNVLFRDDKSYPFLYLSEHTFPRLCYLRGKASKSGKYFGPYPSTTAVRQTLTVLQKLFKIRQCDDHFFKNRSRPCLQYQIQRCTAPCVNYITPEDYAQDVQNVSLFLEGKEDKIIKELIHRMDEAAVSLNYEMAAALRDQITALRQIHDEQVVHRDKGNADVVTVSELNGEYCIQLLYIRQGQILDSHAFYPKQQGLSTAEDVLRGFLSQFYLDRENKRDYPREILLSHAIEDQTLFEEILSKAQDHKISINQPQRGDKLKWIELALTNGQSALKARASQSNTMQKRWLELKKELGITNGLNRIECFDISHTQGEATMASCVVFDCNGPVKSDYRTYNLDVGNNDYEAMEQVLQKRYIKRKALELSIPEVIIIDGGKGQLNRAKKAVLEAQIFDVILIAMAKGEGRKPGLETLYVCKSSDETEGIIKLSPTSIAFHLLQHIRDESHRFAIKGHRRKRGKARKQSTLEAIAGVGKKRSQILLNYFGGLQGLMAASQQSIATVPGIGEQLAVLIYRALHEE